eukprot:14132-Heterococcus_DN1.PRE.10
MSLTCLYRQQIVIWSRKCLLIAFTAGMQLVAGVVTHVCASMCSYYQCAIVEYNTPCSLYARVFHLLLHVYTCQSQQCAVVAEAMQ